MPDDWIRANLLTSPDSELVRMAYIRQRDPHRAEEWQAVAVELMKPKRALIPRLWRRFDAWMIRRGERPSGKPFILPAR